MTVCTSVRGLVEAPVCNQLKGVTEMSNPLLVSALQACRGCKFMSMQEAKTANYSAPEEGTNGTCAYAHTAKLIAMAVTCQYMIR